MPLGEGPLPGRDNGICERHERQRGGAQTGTLHVRSGRCQHRRQPQVTQLLRERGVLRASLQLVVVGYRAL